MDFTLDIYNKLIKNFKNNSFTFIPFYKYNTYNTTKLIILRHDVDRLPEKSLELAQICYHNDVKCTFNFRLVSKVYQSKIIKQIVDLGHEIGYHYEDLALEKGDIDKAYDSFCKNLQRLRKLYPVKTICMHGSPLSKWDSRLIWNKYDYNKLGIIAEPYFDLDYSKILYITDTGRRWNAQHISVRDKVNAEKNLQEKYIFTSSSDIITACNNMKLPNKIMLNIHPHRWFNFGIGWTNELIFQNFKNVIKFFIVKTQ